MMRQGKDSIANSVHHPAEEIIRVEVLDPALLMADHSEIIGDYWYRAGGQVERDEVRTAEFCRTFGRLGDPNVVYDNARRMWRDTLPRRDAWYSTEDAARELGVDPSRVRRMARARGLGQRLGRRSLMFTADDIDAMRVRKPGRPRRDNALT